MAFSPLVQELIHRVPRPPEDADVPGGIGPAAIDAFELDTGIRVPPEVRDWLSICNGPCIGPGGLFGIACSDPTLDMTLYLRLRPEWQRMKWLPIAGDGCGNAYLMATCQEFGPGFPVFFVDTISDAGKPTYLVASGLERFLEFVLEDDLSPTGWPFDRRFVLDRDPGMAKLSGAPLPWEA